MGIAGNWNPTTAMISVQDPYLLALVEKALAAEGLVLNADITTASGTTFYGVGPSAEKLAEAGARTAAGNND